MSLAELELTITGMRCTRCSNKIEEHIKKISGIQDIVISVALSKGRIQFDDKLVGARDIVESIGSLGFGVKLIDKFSPVDFINKQQQSELKTWRNTFLMCSVFGAITMLFHGQMLTSSATAGASEHGHHHDHQLMSDLLLPGLSTMNLVMFLLSTPTQIIGGLAFYPHALRAMRHGRSNMDVLVLFATSVGYSYSIVILGYFMLMSMDYSPRTFFDIPPMLFTFVSLGRWLEHIARGKTSEALTKLMILQPNEATIVEGYRETGTPDDRDSGDPLDTQNDQTIKTANYDTEKVVDIRLVQHGDILKVSPESKVPVDGIVVHGGALVDESLVTGESGAVAKKVGSSVISGSLNTNGVILIKATRVGQDTTLAQIVKLVETAQTTKAPIQNYADKVAAYFVPMIFSMSVVTLLVWIVIGISDPGIVARFHPVSAKNGALGAAIEFAFQCALTVLAIACPCALGLATPTAVMVGTGLAAKHGILIKSASSLETAHKVSHIIFDKTGTVTNGQPIIDKLSIFVNKSQQALSASSIVEHVKLVVALMGSTEVNSPHPLARALTNFSVDTISTKSLLRPQKYLVHPGLGTEAEFENTIAGREFGLATEVGSGAAGCRAGCCRAV